MIVDNTKGLSLLFVADESYCCDNFDDRVLPTLIELTSVLPNVGVIGRALKTYKEDVLSKKLLFFYLHATQLTLLCYAVKCWRKFQPRLHYLVYFQKGVACCLNVKCMPLGGQLVGVLFCFGWFSLVVNHPLHIPQSSTSIKKIDIELASCSSIF